jgi:hypothetical protein
VFGQISTAGLIENSITNILNNITAADSVIFNMNTTGVGTYQIGETVYQGYSVNSATATAKVVTFNNNQLTLKNVQGNFVSSQPIIGLNTNANFLFTSYQIQPLNLAQIVITPNPDGASANDKYTYTTTVTETPYINTVVPDSSKLQGDLISQFGFEDLITESGSYDLITN